MDGSGQIRYTEFLAATIESQGDISEERLAEAFDRFDTDDSGYISVDNLAEILGKDFPRNEIQDILGDAVDDLDSSSSIGTMGGDSGSKSRSRNGTCMSYSAFFALWECNNEKEVQGNKSITSENQCNLSTLAPVNNDCDGDGDEADTTTRSISIGTFA